MKEITNNILNIGIAMRCECVRVHVSVKYNSFIVFVVNLFSDQIFMFVGS